MIPDFDCIFIHSQGNLESARHHYMLARQLDPNDELIQMNLNKLDKTLENSRKQRPQPDNSQNFTHNDRHVPNNDRKHIAFGRTTSTVDGRNGSRQTEQLTRSTSTQNERDHRSVRAEIGTWRHHLMQQHPVI
jgi:hypothetical protein